MLSVPTLKTKIAVGSPFGTKTSSRFPGLGVCYRLG
jgi:hypothetical protein